MKNYLAKGSLRLRIILRRIFLEDLGLKLLSVGIATLLWVYVASEEKTEISIKVPIRFVNLPPDKAIIGDVPSNVDVLLSGPKSIVFGLMNKDLEYKVDMKGAQIGLVEVRVEPEALGISNPLKILRISPSLFTVRVDKIEKKRVKVVPQITGEPDEDYVISNLIASPTKVDIIGPSTYLRTVEVVKTKKVEINGIKKTETFKVPLEVSDSNGIKISPDKVELKVMVSEKIVKQTLKNIKVKLKGYDGKYKILPPFITITILGPSKKVASVKSKDINVYIDLTGEGPGRYRRRAIIELESSFTLLDTQPSWFDVYLF